jgi:TPP-dependent pyruvate/acetoin dehydrogenase alpha subunit
LDEYMSRKDPVRRFEELLRSRNVVSEQDVADLEERVRGAFEAGYEYALSSPFPEPGDVTKGLFTDDGYWANEPGRRGGTQT